MGFQDIRGWGACLVLSVGAAACAEYPEAEFERAVGATEAAIAEEAPLYAEHQFREATQSLAAARLEMTRQDDRFFLERDYARAAEMLLDAAVAARLAEDTALDRKEETRLRAISEIESARLALESATLSLSVARPLPESEFLSQGLAMEVAVVDEALSEARHKLDQGRFLDALKQSMSANIRVARIRHRIRMGLGD